MTQSTSANDILLLVTNRSCAHDMLFDCGRIAGVGNFSGAGDRDFQSVAYHDVSIGRTGGRDFGGFGLQ
jgi:hypothetical protein